MNAKATSEWERFEAVLRQILAEKFEGIKFEIQLKNRDRSVLLNVQLSDDKPHPDEVKNLLEANNLKSPCFTTTGLISALTFTWEKPRA